MSLFISIGIVVLVILYLTYPRFLRRRVSAARFFRDLPQPRKGQSRLRLGRLELTLPFFLQLTVLLLVLASVFFSDKKLKGEEAKGVGVWFMVDTSASMSTIQQGRSRMEAAKQEVESAIEQARQAAKGKELCFRLSAMDQERRDMVVSGDALAVRQAVSNLEPRPLGTDLGVLRRAIRLLKDQAPAKDWCRVSQVVVVTDIPAPGWEGENEDISIVWCDIGQPVENLGFTDIRPVRNPLTGVVSEVLIEVTAYGAAPANARLLVTAPEGTTIKDEVIDWRQGSFWQGSFLPGGAGLYRMQLTPGGAYAYDDTAAVEIDQGREIRVDWQLKDRRYLEQLGWIDDKTSPFLRVTDNIDNVSNPSEIPVLIVGAGYGKGELKNEEPRPIRDFVEASPLLADVNLDAAEAIGIRGIELPGEFQPVLRGMEGRAWIAQAENPLRALVPGIPTGTEDTVGRFSTAVFFNAVRWLLQKRELPPLYTLTTPYELEPTGSRLVLHKDEGNTRRVPRSSGKIADLKLMIGKGASVPLWPILLMVAVVLFLIERAMAAWKK